METLIVFNSDKQTLVVQYLYTVENHLTFNIVVKSGDFSGASHFCLPKETVVNTIATLSKMHTDLKGHCTIKDCDSDAFINIEMRTLGHADICGQIGGSHEDHLMKFRYTLDQTMLPNLIEILKAALS